MAFLLPVVLVLVSVFAPGVVICGGLSPGFYSETCPGVEQIISPVIVQAVEDEPRMGASLLRLHFHDCFVDGCDASICLDDSGTIKSEKKALPNANSTRGFEVIERAKAEVERFCPGVVSCADIIALAARDAVHALKGPYWQVLYGRRDSLNANFNAATTDLPSPNSTYQELAQKFANKGLSQLEMVALSGAHTIGKAHCKFFKNRLFNFQGSGKPDPTMNTELVSELQFVCGASESRLVPLDSRSTEVFDNNYFKGLVSGRGILRSDHEIGKTDQAFVYHFDEPQFFHDFGVAMVKMGSINPLTGSRGEIRRNCALVNSENV